MKYPTYNLEKKLSRQGYQYIVGIDEVGRGALAGPLVAVATRIFNFKFLISKQIQNPRLKIFKQVKDSKLLSENQREKIFEELSEQVEWAVGMVSHAEIDQMGIATANILAVRRAIENLKIKPDYLLIDQVYGFYHHLPHQLIVKGDAKVLSISVASILAKVFRDRLMKEYHQKYPNYHFDRHKGYGTALHLRCLKDYGACLIHRKSFKI